jgi:hypothetical protein
MRHDALFQISHIALSGVLCIVASCAEPPSAPDQCGTFPSELSEAGRFGILIEDVTVNRSLDKAIAKIRQCYPSATYHRPGVTFAFEKASRGSDGNYYIFFRFMEVTDYNLVFRANSNGEIESVFEYSLFHEFAVPD